MSFVKADMFCVKLRRYIPTTCTYLVPGPFYEPTTETLAESLAEATKTPVETIAEAYARPENKILREYYAKVLTDRAEAKPAPGPAPEPLSRHEARYLKYLRVLREKGHPIEGNLGLDIATSKPLIKENIPFYK